MTETAGFDGARVVIFESRRAAEMASLVARHGGVAVAAPSMREVPLGATPELTAFAAELERGAFDAVVFLTGVGARSLFEAAAPVLDREGLLAALGRTRVVVRGPKPAAFLRQLGFAGFHAAPAPNTWRETADVLLEALGSRPGGPRGARIALQEYGVPHDELVDRLSREGVATERVPVYRWALPEDTGPLRAALVALARREVRIALFTSARQVEHALAIAREEGLGDEWIDALRAGVVASIGPVCTEALADAGLAPDIEPEHAKMGHLVKETAQRASGVLHEKDAARGA
jgi:uroporphyrinogen-III synthase